MATPAGTTCSTEVLQLRIDARDEMCHSRWMKIRWCGSTDRSTAAEQANRVQSGCGYGRKLMVTAVQLARMSCTQRQRSGGAERDEGHVGGMRIP